MDMELLSSTDVSCYWKQKKKETGTLYKPIPLLSTPCLSKTINKPMILPQLHAEEVRNFFINKMPLSAIGYHK